MTGPSNLDNVSPDTTNATVDQLDLSYILNASWRTFVDRWQSIAGVTLWGMLYGAVGLLVISVAVVALVMFGISSNAFPVLATLLLVVLGIIALIGLLFLGGWIQLSQILAISQPAKASMASARPRTWGMVGLSVLVGITTLAGFIFFIIPGIILSIWFSQAQYIYAIDDIGGTKAMGLSRDYVRGRWWKTFGYLLIPSLAVYACTSPLNYIANFASSQIVLAVLALALLSVNVAGSLFILCYGYHLYRALKATSSIPTVASNDG